MATTLHSAVDQLNRIKNRAATISAGLSFLRLLILTLLTISVWALIQPQEQMAQLALGAVVLVVGALASGRSLRRPAITASDVALAAEISYGAAAPTPLDTRSDTVLPAYWAEALRSEVSALQHFHNRRHWTTLSTLIIPAAACFLTLPSSAPSLKLALSEVSKAVARLHSGATLTVMQGAATAESSGKALPLSSKDPLALELLAQNLVKIQLSGAGSGPPPSVELRRHGGSASDGKEAAPAPGATPEPSVFQSFQMAKVEAAKAGQDELEAPSQQAEIAFAVSEDVDLYIPALAAQPLAHIKVRQLPIPKVKLSLAAPKEDPWPDDQPLPLHIDVHGENPLQTVRLLIKSDQKVSKELVASVMTEDKYDISTDYRVTLETYVENDVAEVEIVAEAVDRAVPTPLVGVSEPLRLTTASAYGRYRQSLQTLREVKTMLDAALEAGSSKLPEHAAKIADKAADQSERSPFFDGLDRLQIHHFAQSMHELEAEPKDAHLAELSQALNDFLFEHEILDDRERDRDFFVAARSLSRLLEQEPSRRQVQLGVVTKRITSFLNGRYERWVKRVARLSDEARPPAWAKVRQKPFHAALAKIDALALSGKKTAQGEQLTILSKAVVDYRSWIQELEAAEDRSRDQEDQQRQEGLASARNTLRDLQKRQGQVSAELDKADERAKEQLANDWPATRLKQNANTKDTHRLEGEMRSLSPPAAARVDAAAKAMEATAEAGNNGDFSVAESNADMAGRLLRQAESAAQQSQQKRRSRGRRRQVSGDNYYGQSVVGGDVEIKREYQVDRRYREDILDEVQTSGYDEENRTLLENYLRHVIR